jgi:hypothetical protein
VQYIGRILRTTDTKTTSRSTTTSTPAPCFARNTPKRLATYKTLGFDPPPRR